MNEFIIKACENLLINCGCTDFNHVRFTHSSDEHLVYIFNFTFDTHNFYFCYHDDSKEEFDLQRDIVDQIEEILNAYKDEKAFQQSYYFAFKHCLYKLNFCEKKSFNINSNKAYKFQRFCSSKYHNCKEFLDDFDNIDIVEVLGAYE